MENFISSGMVNVLVSRSGELWHRAQSLATGWVWWQLRQSWSVLTIKPPCCSPVD
jgi:hypothetical protein